MSGSVASGTPCITEGIQTNKVHNPIAMPLLSGDIYWSM